jgi:hypothetical protein
MITHLESRRTCSSASPTHFTIISAKIRCCLGLQCISKDKTTGGLWTRNAQSAMAPATLSKLSTVHKVCPLWSTARD